MKALPSPSSLGENINKGEVSTYLKLKQGPAN